MEKLCTATNIGMPLGLNSNQRRTDFVSGCGQMLLLVERHLKKNDFWFENIRGSNPGRGKKCLGTLAKQLVKASVSFVIYVRPSVRMA